MGAREFLIESLEDEEEEEEDNPPPRDGMKAGPAGSSIESSSSSVGLEKPKPPLLGVNLEPAADSSISPSSLAGCGVTMVGLRTRFRVRKESWRALSSAVVSSSPLEPLLRSLLILSWGLTLSLGFLRAGASSSCARTAATAKRRQRLITHQPLTLSPEASLLF